MFHPNVHEFNSFRKLCIVWRLTTYDLKINSILNSCLIAIESKYQESDWKYHISYEEKEEDVKRDLCAVYLPTYLLLEHVQVHANVTTHSPKHNSTVHTNQSHVIERKRGNFDCIFEHLFFFFQIYTIRINHYFGCKVLFGSGAHIHLNRLCVRVLNSSRKSYAWASEIIQGLFTNLFSTFKQLVQMQHVFFFAGFSALNLYARIEKVYERNAGTWMMYTNAYMYTYKRKWLWRWTIFWCILIASHS